ncbi:MAG: alpha-E domain-containing protein [Oscillospiraceae bacterium]|nr:alpha-E domain-containing protein [Oscillospiraceae bacterium]
MGIISIEQADHILWLGRYTERVYTTVQLYNTYFDSMIDGVGKSYPEFCEKLDIPNIYESTDDFMHRYPFDRDNPDSIICNLLRAYDNAIVLRETIGSESLAYIQLAIYDWKKASENPAPLMETQKLIDHIMAFWGITDDVIDSEEVRNILKAGKRIERVDLFARLGMPPKSILREIHRLCPRVEKSSLPYDASKLIRLNELANNDKIDYYEIVREVESIF